MLVHWYYFSIFIYESLLAEIHDIWVHSLPVTVCHVLTFNYSSSLTKDFSNWLTFFPKASFYCNAVIIKGIHMSITINMQQSTSKFLNSYIPHPYSHISKVLLSSYPGFYCFWERLTLCTFKLKETNV